MGMRVSSRTAARIIRAALALLAIAIVVLSVILQREYHAVAPFGVRGTHAELIAALEERPSGTVLSPDMIRPWMTFEYVNDVFHLSPEMVRTALSINDARYPRLTITTFARLAGLPVDDALLRVQDAVRTVRVSDD